MFNYQLIIILSLINCIFASALFKGLLPQLDGRIVGGISTDISNFPFQVSLQRYGSHFCGGSIIKPHIIVTAAHCLQHSDDSNMRIRAGSSIWRKGGSLIAVLKYIVHENYSAALLTNDIGIVFLKSALQLGQNIKVIPLAEKSAVHNANAVVSGWGTVSYGASSLSNVLRYINTKIVGWRECASGQYGYGEYIKYSMICAYATGKDACQGDSGGPLVSDGYLVGIVSWGYGCAEPHYPGVYADVAAFNKWLQTIIENT